MPSNGTKKSQLVVGDAATAAVKDIPGVLASAPSSASSTVPAAVSVSSAASEYSCGHNPARRSNMMDEPSLKKAKVAPAQDTPIYSSVAMKIMEKMGHKDGQGLGRDGQGISSPVRAREDLKGRAAVRGGGRGVGYGEEKLQPAQKEAVDAALRGDNVFITGPAGTGKSVVLNRIIKHFKLSHRPSGYVAVAPTGPTAISVGGQTIQSFAGCGVPVTPVDFEKCWSRKKDWRALDVMVIEEVSMISGEFFDRLSCVVSAIRKDARPFGGIQLILCGDFLQLPPIPMPIYNVREAKKANPDVALHRDRGFVFQSRAWQKAQLTVIQLEKVFRQTNTDFKKVLHEIRFGKVTKEALAFLKQCERPLPDTQSGITATTLYATKRDVRSENDFHLKKLSGPEHVFHASDNINVEFDAPADARDKLWANSFFETCIAEKALKLREGAQVMLIKNEIRKSDLQRLVNGSRGVVVGFTTELTNDDAADYGYPHGEKKYRGYTTRELEREVAFIRPDGSTKRKDKQWCIDNGFKQVSPDVWSGDWHKNYPPDPVYPIVQFKNGRTKTVLPEDFESRIVGLGTCIRTATPLQLAWAVSTISYITILCSH